MVTEVLSAPAPKQRLPPPGRKDITITRFDLAGIGSDAFELTQVRGNVNGQTTILYMLKQTRYQGDGMSTSPLTRTDSARIFEERNDFARKLREFYRLKSEFDGLDDKTKAQIRKGWKTQSLPQYYAKYGEIFYNERYQQMFESAQKNDNVHYGAETLEVSRHEPYSLNSA